MTSTPAHDALTTIRERYVRALLDGDAIAAHGHVAEALELVPVAEVYLDVVHPALHEVGRRWERDTVNVAEEHLATSVSEVMLAELAGRLPRTPRRNRTAIVACGPGEQHAIGSRIVADFLEADGWDTLHLGATTPGSALAELTVARHAEVIAISVSLPLRIPEVADACRRLKALPFAPVVALGGQAFTRPSQAFAVGADLHAGSPTDLVAALGDRFPR
ncbi:cobalamin-dependent protein [Conexibacter sp. JD483]|uniref:cobalamin B12-binding domain-containing protein n=1 Tax=unclassified Conexibacter TaxID=2627773 RepID=UPI00271A7BD0|nr:MULTISPECIES: B12-binding domain-containing protein [unclassified Conexibacter]MDO8186868.1 cobalamin-dependent protein [Conexibacter sp. CPCC 205706]MDO8200820.1 cobalamin-dependent protein [Conexibacter sp. CPCC 205762]MDR9369956.1 cobalamin-dependent protein [Conexibacter sp. JD483]